jgi:hypothetical protein
MMVDIVKCRPRGTIRRAMAMHLFIRIARIRNVLSNLMESVLYLWMNIGRSRRMAVDESLILHGDERYSQLGGPDSSATACRVSRVRRCSEPVSIRNVGDPTGGYSSPWVNNRGDAIQTGKWRKRGPRDAEFRYGTMTNGVLSRS